MMTRMDGVKNCEYLEARPITRSPSPRADGELGKTARSIATRPPLHNVPPRFGITWAKRAAHPDSQRSYNFLAGAATLPRANPLSVIMNGHSNITAIFGITNSPRRLRSRKICHSSVGTPPDLTNIAPGKLSSAT